jgi:hypothetical protein
MMADGVTTIYSRGQQYEGVFPLLNFTLLPVITNEHMHKWCTIQYGIVICIVLGLDSLVLFCH